MTSFSWLHLTDLHLGQSHAKWLWPNVREEFFKDLDDLHSKCGPWNAVLVTGDLTQRGAEEEFNEINHLLGSIWDTLERLGSKPILLAVPGNHDLVRPPARLARQALRRYHATEKARIKFW
jgi:3',5'-cyclic AMP phosphodiesterase CpdA